MATQRFEFVGGSSQKFWEIHVKGSAHTVRYGRIGTDGQTKTKDFASPAAAKSAAEKLIATKVKKGYVPAKGKAPKKTSSPKKATKKATKKAPKKAPKKTSKRVIGDAVHVVERAWPKGSFVGLWEDGKDLWMAGCDAGKKPKDVTAQEMLDAEGFVHRWRFESPKHAKTAVKAIKAERPKKGRVPDWLEPDVGVWAGLLEERDHPRIARFAVSKSGPVTLERTGNHQWLHPRPPSSCWCGRVLTPMFALSGPVDRRLGKKTNIFVSFCAGSSQGSYCEGTMEVVVQPEERKKPAAEHYFLHGREFYVVAESRHWDPIGSSISYAITEHFGEKGAPGTRTSKRFRKLEEADEYLKKITARKEAAKPGGFGKWYRDILKEMNHFHRVPGVKPVKLKLKETIPPMHVSGSSYSDGNAFFDKSDQFGGAPNYTQSEWSKEFDCPSCGKTMLFIFQVGQGAAWWSDLINDGDAGSFQFFACPHCKGPHGGAMFESH